MKKIFIVSAAILALCACDKIEGPVSNEIKFNIGYPSTKATSTAFEANDAITLYATEYEGEKALPLQIGGNFFNNEKLIYNGSAWKGVRTLYWSDKPCDFYAVYPYQGDIKTVEAHPFTIDVNQNGDGYEASDLLFAKAEKVSRNANGVDLLFDHLLSKVKVNLIKGDKFEGDIPDDIIAHIYNTTVEGTLDLTKGVVVRNSLGAKRTITMKKIDNQHFEAVVIPQNLERKTPLIEITMGGIAYVLDYSLSFRPGYVHTINVTLNTSPEQEKIEISIDPGVEGWN